MLSASQDRYESPEIDTITTLSKVKVLNLSLKKESWCQPPKPKPGAASTAEEPDSQQLAVHWEGFYRELLKRSQNGRCIISILYYFGGFSKELLRIIALRAKGKAKSLTPDKYLLEVAG